MDYTNIQKQRQSSRCENKFREGRIWGDMSNLLKEKGNLENTSSEHAVQCPGRGRELRGNPAELQKRNTNDKNAKRATEIILV